MIFLSIAFLPFVFSGVVAQSTNATCIISSFDWIFNSNSESPCLVASILLGVCFDNTYNLPSLPEGHHYLGPTTLDGATICECNTVVYSLISACAVCQNRAMYSWREWSANCATVLTSGFGGPIPSGLSVPGWAYLDVKKSGFFDVELAKENANLTESTAILPPTSTAKPTSSTASSTSASESASNTEGAMSSTDTDDSATVRANMIGSSVVGALLGVGVICGTVAFALYFRRRRRLQRRLTSSETSPEPVTRQV